MQVKSLELSKVYKTRFIQYQKLTDRFKIPIIIFSSIATFFNFGLQPYFSQQVIAIICSSLTFMTGLLSTIELYLQINKQMEMSLKLSKDLFMNSMNIYRILSLDKERRVQEGLEYLNERYEVFRQIIEKSEIMPDKGILPPLEFFRNDYKSYGEDMLEAEVEGKLQDDKRRNINMPPLFTAGPMFKTSDFYNERIENDMSYFTPPQVPDIHENIKINMPSELFISNILNKKLLETHHNTDANVMPLPI